MVTPVFVHKVTRLPAVLDPVCLPTNWPSMDLLPTPERRVSELACRSLAKLPTTEGYRKTTSQEPAEGRSKPPENRWGAGGGEGMLNWWTRSFGEPPGILTVRLGRPAYAIGRPSYLSIWVRLSLKKTGLLELGSRRNLHFLRSTLSLGATGIPEI